MKCEDCQKVLEEYFDGELGERETLEARSHLSACAACAQELEVLRDEANLYALYRRDVEVTPALWNGVAKRIRDERSAEPRALGWREKLASLFGTPRLSPALTFALVILAVGATIGLMKLMQSSRTTQTTARSQSSARTGQGTPAPSNAKENQAAAPDVNEGEQGTTAKAGAQEEAEAGRKPESIEKPVRTLAVAERAAESRRNSARPGGFDYEDSPEELVREAEQKYRAAIALLSRDAKRRRTLLEPDVMARFDQTLAAVDRTIDETRRAARRQPEDPVAVQYMLAAYAKKVEVLREMAAYRVDDRGIQ
jgi:anti-sigma factor RsiW